MINFKPLLLICDDDPVMLQVLHLSFQSQFRIVTSNTVFKAKELTKTNTFDVAIIDLNFEGQDTDGLHLLDFMSNYFSDTYLIVLSGDSSIKRIVEATRRKLFDFVIKDENHIINLQTILNKVNQNIHIQKEEARNTSKSSTDTLQEYKSRSKKVKELLGKINVILKSRSEAPILILGETGTGKEVLAKHIAINAKLNVFPANMSCIQKETAESTLFGHTRGAFTGANADTTGLIETAHGGIFFLDEIGECSLSVQSKLLRVLQEKEVQPLGSTKCKKINVRFIAATHCDLDKMVNDGLFRKDLLQRLNAFVFRLPPLRERPEDILFYTKMYLNEAVEKEKHDKSQTKAMPFNKTYTITSDGEEALLAYSWPGNIRELKNVVERIVVLSNKYSVDNEVAICAILNCETIADIDNPELAKTNDIKMFLNQMVPKLKMQSQAQIQAQNKIDKQKEKIINALDNCNGSKRHAALLLKISEATLYRWLIKFKISAPSEYKKSCINPTNHINCNGVLA